MRSAAKIIAIGSTLAAALTACEKKGPTEVACDASLRPSVIVEARDNAGKAAAIGATLTLIGATDVINRGQPLKGFGDSLKMIAGGNNIAGPMDVVLSKPWHTTTSIRGLKLATDDCGVMNAALIGFTLRRVANAPALRQVVVDPTKHEYTRAGVAGRIAVVVLADDSVSHDLTWTSRDAGVATVSADGVLTTSCRKTTGSTYIVAASSVDPAVRDSVTVTVAPDNDKTRCPG
ncbi:MAG TPA: hypothetical protein VF042_16550 [Gemmatimonadaceae bacterium]